MKVSIVIAQRGWVFVGEVSEQDGKVVINKAQNVRRWGTSRGLGQIAANGPTENTVLDPAGIVTLHPLSIVAQIECDGSKWPEIVQ